MYYHVKFAFFDFKISWYNAYDLAWVRRLLRLSTPLRSADWTTDTTEREVSALLDQLMADAVAQPDAPAPDYAPGQSPAEQIIAWANKSVIEDTTTTFKQVIGLIIDHALDPQDWPQDGVLVPHAKLLRALRKNMDARLHSLPASMSGNTPIYGENLFHDALICCLGQSYRLTVEQSSPTRDDSAAASLVPESAPATPQGARRVSSPPGIYDRRTDASPSPRPGPSRDPSSINTSSISAAPSSMGTVSAAGEADRSLLAFFVVELYNQRAISTAFVHRYIVEVLIHTPTECDLRSLIIIIDALGKELDTKDRAPGPKLYTYLLRKPIKTNHDLMAVYMNRLVLASQSELQTPDVQDECKRVRDRRTYDWKQDPSRPSSQAYLAFLYESPRQDESGSRTSISTKAQRRNARIISDPDINFERRQRLQAILPTNEAVISSAGAGEERSPDGYGRPTLGYRFSSASFRNLSGMFTSRSESRRQSDQSDVASSGNDEVGGNHAIVC